VNDEGRIRLQIRCRGTVQGVGFRPTIHRIASALGLVGWVINDPQGATLEIEGPAEVVDTFLERLPTELPPLARLDRFEQESLEPVGEECFEVRTTTLGRREGALVPPDAVLCDDCRQEMEDADDRRFHYPFTTCTNCGPRFSLVHNLPYDRERTSMGCFPLCPDCNREYTDPADRRFHAEPVACPACGPRLWLADESGEALDSIADPSRGPATSFWRAGSWRSKGWVAFNSPAEPTRRKWSIGFAAASDGSANPSPSWSGISRQRNARWISMRPRRICCYLPERPSSSPRGVTRHRSRPRSLPASTTSG